EFMAEYTYDDADRLTSVTDPLDHETTLDYDANGNLTKTTYANAARVDRTYDDDDLLVSVTHGSGTCSYAFDYAPTHWLTSVTDDLGRGYGYSYNPIGWLTSARDTVNPSVPGGFETAYAYDDAGRVTGMRPSSEETRTYVYDLRRGLTSLELAGDPGGRHTAYEYDRSGLLTSMSLPESSTITYGYDAAGRLASIVDTMPSGVLAFTYERDAVGNITAENSTRYAYDELSRLVSWYDPGTDATTTYAYDANYNLTSAVRDGQTQKSFTFDAADRISSPGYVYDDAGNMTAGGESGYAYDGANRLTTVKDASTEETVATYAYDHLNRRISATEGTATVYFHYDGASPNVIAETGGAGETVAGYVYDSVGRLHSMTRDGETYYYHTNAHGDVVALTDESGEAVNEYSYDPWGASTGATETVENPYRYASYRFDGATGLYYCWNRYYDTGTCRWITKDLYPGEVESPGTMNGYAYCLGNPVNLVDRNGREPHGPGMADGYGPDGYGDDGYGYGRQPDSDQEPRHEASERCTFSEQLEVEYAREWDRIQDSYWGLGVPTGAAAVTGTAGVMDPLTTAGAFFGSSGYFIGTGFGYLGTATYNWMTE
ncbi:MAG: RHS repeat-associated core domain-containing protein, partial [Coriobacteriia bacterium]|nr:RHS repeat-associated core domain-containing protein [Coriobacteriia bacterium]